MWGMFCRYFGPFNTGQDPPDKEVVPKVSTETMVVNKDWVEWYCKNDNCSEVVAYRVGARLLLDEIYSTEEMRGITLLPRDSINPYLVRIYRIPPASNLPLPRGLVMKAFDIPSPAVVEEISQTTKASHTSINRLHRLGVFTRVAYYKLVM